MNFFYKFQSSHKIKIFQQIIYKKSQNSHSLHAAIEKSVTLCLTTRACYVLSRLCYCCLDCRSFVHNCKMLYKMKQDISVSL